MGLGLPVAVAAALLGAATQPAEIRVDDPTGCVDAAAVGPALEGALSADLQQLPAGIFALDLAVAPGEDHHHATLAVRLTWSTGGEPLLDRTVPLVRADCPDVPRLVALIVARRLSDLPSQEWERRRPPLPPPPGPPMGLRVGASLGADLGVDATSWAGRVELGLSVGQPAGIRGVFALTASAAAPVPVGDGEAQLTSALFAAGLSWDVPLGPVRLVPWAGAAIGVSVATGRGYQESRTEALPALRGLVEVALHSDLGVYGAVGATVPILRARLRDTGAGATVLEPLVRIHLSVGWAWSTILRE